MTKCTKVSYRQQMTAIAACVRLSGTTGKGWRWYGCKGASGLKKTHYHLTTQVS